jgi:hypothetical protein
MADDGNDLRAVHELLRDLRRENAVAPIIAKEHADGARASLRTNVDVGESSMPRRFIAP